MVSFDTAALITLIIILAIALITNRKKLHFQRFAIFYAALYRTQAGLKTMDKIAMRLKKFWQISAPYIIALGFIGMAFVVFDLGTSLVKIFTSPGAPSVGVVLPFKAKGVFYVPFIYWIISIFVILIIHEGMHGVMARAFGLKVKNSGLVVLGALIPLIPGAFVEPDEKKLVKAPAKTQLAVYAAGPVANIVTGLLLLGLMTFAINPYVETFYAKDGIIVTDLMEGHPPAEIAGIEPGEKIVAMNGQTIKETTDFSEAMKNKKPGDIVNVVTTQAVYDVQLGENPQNKKAWLGIYVDQPLKAPNWATHLVIWIKDLLFWIYLLSIGVGLFNLVPLGPIDGGRMLLTALQKVTHERKANFIWKSVSFGILGILITNLVLAFI